MSIATSLATRAVSASAAGLPSMIFAAIAPPHGSSAPPTLAVSRRQRPLGEGSETGYRRSMAELRASEVVAADVLLVGGGLASSFIALRLKESYPSLRVIVLERELRIGGQHTWCHFATDLPRPLPNWLTPLIVKEWSGYEVRFPKHQRRLSTPYRAITSDRLHEVVSERLGADAWLGVDASDVRAEAVRLVDGRRLTAPLVIDARGPRRSRHLALGWQKFLGQEVRLTAPHGLREPIIMDATVPQID